MITTEGLHLRLDYLVFGMFRFYEVNQGRQIMMRPLIYDLY